MKWLFLLAALWLAGCNIAPEITPSPAATKFSPGSLESADATPTTAPTRSTAISITPTHAPFDVNRGALPLSPGEILYWHENELRIVGRDGSNNRLLLTGEHLEIGLPDTSPSGRYLALSAMRPLVLDLQTGDITAFSDRTQSAIASFFWAPGDVLYYVWYEEVSDWKTWRVEMPATSTQAMIYDPPEGSVVIDVLDDTHLIVGVPFSDRKRQTVLLDWRTGEQRPLAEPGYQLVGISQDHSHAVLYEPGGWRRRTTPHHANGRPCL